MEVIKEGIPEEGVRKRSANNQIKSKSSKKTNKSVGSNYQSKKRHISPPMDAVEIDSNDIKITRENDEVKLTNILTQKRHSSIEEKPIKLAKTNVKKSGSKIVNGKLMTQSMSQKSQENRSKSFNSRIKTTKPVVINGLKKT